MPKRVDGKASRCVTGLIVSLSLLSLPTLGAPAFGEQPQPLRLRSRTVTPAPGVDPALLSKAAAERRDSVHAIVQWPESPQPEEWPGWERFGLWRVSYLGENNWIVRIDLGVEPGSRLEEILRLLGATALIAIYPEYKLSPDLEAEMPTMERRTLEPGLREVMVAFFPGTPPETADRIAKAFHKSRQAPIAQDPLLWAIRSDISSLRKLAREDEVQFVEPAPPPPLPLLDSARRLTGIETVQDFRLAPFPSYHGLSGKGVRLSTDERSPSEYRSWGLHTTLRDGAALS